MGSYAVNFVRSFDTEAELIDYRDAQRIPEDGDAWRYYLAGVDNRWWLQFLRLNLTRDEAWDRRNQLWEGVVIAPDNTVDDPNDPPVPEPPTGVDVIVWPDVPPSGWTPVEDIVGTLQPSHDITPSDSSTTRTRTPAGTNSRPDRSMSVTPTRATTAISPSVVRARRAM